MLVDDVANDSTTAGHAFHRISTNLDMQPLAAPILLNHFTEVHAVSVALDMNMTLDECHRTQSARRRGTGEPCA